MPCKKPSDVELEVLHANEIGVYVLDNTKDSSTPVDTKKENTVTSEPLGNFVLQTVESITDVREELRKRFKSWQQVDKGASINPLFDEVSAALRNPETSVKEIEVLLQKLANKLWPKD